MEAVSGIAIVIILITLALLASRRYSPTIVLALSNVIIFFFFFIGTQGSNNVLLSELSFRSALSLFMQEPWTLITSMFVHADLLHLIFNMLFLIAIGFPLESRIGRGRFAVIYIIGGIAGTLVFSLTEIFTFGVRLVGASGAISALMGAMLMLYPHERIMFFMGPLLTDRFTVRTAVLVWFALQLLLLAFDDSPVAYAAHLGGFTAGAAMAWMIRPEKAAENDLRKMCDISPLKPLCVTYSQKEMYEYAENARDRETRDIWVERLLKDVRCPECNAAIKKRGKGFECTNGHRI
jgi:membrane associated rhomboid family serine protease